MPREILEELEDYPIELGFFTKLVLWASFQDGTKSFAWNKGNRTLKRGQVLTSLPDLAKSRQESDISKARRVLNFLEKRQLIRQESDRNGRVITICNWDEKYTQDFSSDRKPAETSTETRQEGPNNATAKKQSNNKEQGNTTREGSPAQTIFNEKVWDAEATDHAYAIEQAFTHFANGVEAYAWLGELQRSIVDTLGGWDGVRKKLREQRLTLEDLVRESKKLAFSRLSRGLFVKDTSNLKLVPGAGA